jgi:hypothetical protein
MRNVRDGATKTGAGISVTTHRSGSQHPISTCWKVFPTPTVLFLMF